MITLANTFEFLQQKHNIQNALDQAQGGALAGVDFDTLVDVGQTGYIWRSAFSDNDRITFEAPIQLPMEHLVIKFDPEQDLHGYENPWPAGGGENILDPQLVFEPQTVNGLTLATENGYVVTFSGTVVDSAAVIRSIQVSYSEAQSYPAGTYSIPPNLTMQLRRPSDGTYIGNKNGAAFTVDEDFYVYQAWFTFAVGTTGSSLGTLFVSLTVGSTVPTSWSPYSNECPITGYTGLTAYHSGEATGSPSEIAVLWEDEAGIVYGANIDLITGLLTVEKVAEIFKWSAGTGPTDLGNFIRKRFVFTYQCLQNQTSDICNLAPRRIGHNSDTLHFYITDSAYVFLPEDTDGDTDVQVCYSLATPITYQLDPVTVSTLLGVNNIWSDVNTTGIAVTYRDDDPLMLSDPLGVGMMTLK